MSKKKKIIISVLGIVAITFFLGFARSRHRDKGSLSQPIKKGSIIESVFGIGTVTANRSYQVKVGVNNTIIKLYVKEGDFVKKGQNLVQMDAGFFRAPFDGTVTFLPSKEGENVFANSVVLSMVDLNDRYIVVSLEQQGALRVHNGQSARLNFDSMRQTSYDGQVEAVYSHETNFLVRINVTNLPAQILPGMTADVAIGVNEHKNALVIPVAALSSGKVHVKSNDYGNSREVDVKTGIVDGAWAEVISGDIKEGDQLFISTKSTP